jgi:hypothetical protein
VDDHEVVAEQLGRPPRGLRGVAHRCPCGCPDVVETAPRLEDGTPFPTLFYLTCPRAVAAGVEPLPSGTQSAGGLPDRVKCLHALVAHELAVPGANRLGREAADEAGAWWAAGPCVPCDSCVPRDS